MCWCAAVYGVIKNNNNNNNNNNKVVTLEALRPGSVLVSRERRESLGEEECL